MKKTRFSMFYLAGYLLEHGWFQGERLECRVEQGYEIRRPSLLRLRAGRRDGGPRLGVGGRVVPVARGTLL